MAAPYLDVDAFKARADLIQPTAVDQIETRWAGFTAQQIAIWSSHINARLKKRYAVPFQGTVPEVVLGWLTTFVTRSCWHRRGYNAQDPAMQELAARCDQAAAELKEAADAKDGLFDLPTNDAAGDSAVVDGSPLGYSETSPYVWQDIEAAAGSFEDGQGRGSSS